MSLDEDIPSTASQGRRKTRRPVRSRIGGKQDTRAELEVEEVPSSQEGKASQIGRLARHLLYATANEKDGALKDVVAQKEHCFSKKEYPYVLRQASSAIEHSFGCKVVHRANQSHIVRMECVGENCPLDSMAQAKKGLLSAILMFIFAFKNKKTNVSAITETALISFLRALGLSYSTPDPIFGDIKKFISPTSSAEFVHEGYISFAKSSDPCGTQVITYDWGPRAILVCEPMVMLNSFCSILKDPQVNKWSSQVETTNELEQEKRQIIKNSENYMFEDK
uniref:MAGE domain-containing protein n=1 Tax=Angiostrongylus cantonensis TaxID=6313 RepID=A0A0K0CVN3_ANGCA